MRLNRKTYSSKEPLKLLQETTVEVSHNDLKRIMDPYLDGPSLYRIKKFGKTTIIRNGIIAEYKLT